MDELKNRAMLARVSFGRPAFRKVDKRISEEVRDSHNMSDDAGRYNKVLIAKENLEAWDKCVTAIRTRFYQLSLPWDDSGYRIVSPDTYFDLQKVWREETSNLARIKREFIAGYSDMVKAQYERLRGAFDPAEYPSSDELEERFKFDMSVMGLPKEGDFRHQLTDEDERRILASAEARMADSVKDIYARLLTTVRHLAETTADKDRTKNCRTTTVSNLRDLVEIAPKLNIMGDPLFDLLVDEARELVDEIDISDIKKDDAVRRDVAERSRVTADNILQTMEGVFG